MDFVQVFAPVYWRLSEVLFNVWEAEEEVEVSCQLILELLVQMAYFNLLDALKESDDVGIEIIKLTNDFGLSCTMEELLDHLINVLGYFVLPSEDKRRVELGREGLLGLGEHQAG